MRLDHVSWAAGPEGLLLAAQRIGQALGVQPVTGGVHPRFGTRNTVLPLAGGHYVEVVEVLDHPASDKAAFGQAVRARSAAGGGWLAWVVAVDDLGPAEQRLGRAAVAGNRHRPDGVELRWRQIGISDSTDDPQLPYLCQWLVGDDLHPSADARIDAPTISSLRIAGQRETVFGWLGADSTDPMPQLRVHWSDDDPHGLVAVEFSCGGHPVVV